MAESLPEPGTKEDKLEGNRSELGVAAKMDADMQDCSGSGTVATSL